MKTTRCTDCAAEFDDLELQGAHGCPACGTTSVPCAIREDVTVRVNWHELRILGIWASNYAAERLDGQPGRRTLSSILRRLEAQHPDKAPLSLLGEARAVSRDLGLDVEVRQGGTAVKIPKPDLS